MDYQRLNQRLDPREKAKLVWRRFVGKIGKLRAKFHRRPPSPPQPPPPYSEPADQGMNVDGAPRQRVSSLDRLLAPLMKPIPKPAPKPVPEPVVKPIPEPARQSILEPIPQSVPGPFPDFRGEPDVRAEPAQPAEPAAPPLPAYTVAFNRSIAKMKQGFTLKGRVIGRAAPPLASIAFNPRQLPMDLADGVEERPASVQVQSRVASAASSVHSLDSEGPKCGPSSFDSNVTDSKHPERPLIGLTEALEKVLADQEKNGSPSRQAESGSPSQQAKSGSPSKRVSVSTCEVPADDGSFASERPLLYVSSPSLVVQDNVSTTSTQPPLDSDSDRGRTMTRTCDYQWTKSSSAASGSKTCPFADNLSFEPGVEDVLDLGDRPVQQAEGSGTAKGKRKAELIAESITESMVSTQDDDSEHESLKLTSVEGHQAGPSQARLSNRRLPQSEAKKPVTN